jgi:hypothetical protein
MSAGKLDISIEQGTTFELKMTLKDELGARIDLTGHTFQGQVRKTYSDSTVQANFSFTLADQTNPATKGDVLASLTPAQTTALAVNPAEEGSVDRPDTPMIYDIESQILPSGHRYRWLQGKANISPEVTK